MQERGMFHQTERIQYITKNYSFLRGLILVPTGLFLFLNAVWTLWLYYKVFPTGENFPGDVFAFVFFPYGLLLYATYLLGKYYRDRFGLVQAPEQQARRTALELLGIFLICFVGMLLDQSLRLPIVITGLFIASILCYRWYQLGRLQNYYLFLAALVVILSFVPLFSPAAYTFLFSHLVAKDTYQMRLELFAGPLITLIGVLDHFFLKKTFTRIRGANLQEVLGREDKNV